jgi:SAM-dependent methyltransferase
MPPEPKLYADLAEWWPLVSAPADYAEEAAFYAQLLSDACQDQPKSILELGSGGGNNASFLKKQFEMTLVDRAPGMLAVSTSLNPECEHLQGDMRTVRLNRQFDAVFIHDAVCYILSEQELRQVIETAWLHCRAGGCVLLCPDCVRETFREDVKTGGHDGPDRQLRYLEWTVDINPDDTVFETYFTFMLRETGQEIRFVNDVHHMGLFSRDTWTGLLSEIGFRAESVPFVHSEIEPGTIEDFIGVKSRS